MLLLLLVVGLVPCRSPRRDAPPPPRRRRRRRVAAAISGER